MPVTLTAHLTEPNDYNIPTQLEYAQHAIYLGVLSYMYAHLPLVVTGLEASTGDKLACYRK